MRILIMITFLTSVFSKLFGGEEKTHYEIADVYAGLRQQILELNEEKLADLKDEPVFAVLMETGYPEAAVTLVAVADGAASLYFSNGGGILGSGEHDNVRPVSLGLVELSARYLEKMQVVEKYPFTTPGYTTFYVVTKDGVYYYKSKEIDLGEERDELSPLFHLGHELIGQIRIAEQNKK